MQSAPATRNRHADLIARLRCLSALQAAIDADRVQPVDEACFREWLEWATWYADSIDPIFKGPHPDEQQEGPVNTPVARLDLTA